MWKSVEGYSRYEISNLGQVRNIKTNKIINGTISQDYVCVSLYPDVGNPKPLRLHRLVASLFCPNPNKYNIVNHIDGNKINNNASNLEWTTSRQNSQHAVDLGKYNVTNYKSVERKAFSNTKIYPSIKDAYEDNKDIIKHLSYIVNACSGRQKTCGGYTWKYVENKIDDCLPEKGKTIKGYSNYLITPDGKIYSKHSNKYLNPSLNRAGYLIVDLHGDEYTKDTTLYTRKRSAKRKKFRVHRLVAEYFIPNPNNYQEVNHKNKNRTDNRVENLEWVTSQENLAHAHNKIVYQYTLNWNLIEKYSSLKEASQSTGINHKNISYATRKGYPYTASKYYWTYSEVRKIQDENTIFIIID